MSTRHPLRPLVVLTLVACAPFYAAAQEPGSSPTHPDALPFGDPQALSVGVPVRIQDALAPPAGDLIFQTVSTNTLIDRTDGFSSPLSETAKLGIVNGFAVNLAFAHTFGPGAPGGVSVNPSFQYVFFNNNNFDNGLPILSVEGSYTAPPGTGFSAGQYGGSAQLTKVIGLGRTAPRLHFNFEYVRLDDDTGRFRPQTFAFGGGISELVNDRTALVADVFAAQTTRRDDGQVFGDLGVNYLVDKQVALGAGAGVGDDGGKVAFRAFLSLSTSIKVFAP